MSQCSQKSRFNKLTLKKNKKKAEETHSDLQMSMDSVDMAFDTIQSYAKHKLMPEPKIYSPIVIPDSSESFIEINASVTDDMTTPSKVGNTSLNQSKNDSSLMVIETKPSNDGWSPAQSIICATPRHLTVPTTPRDEANESVNECSMKDIQQSQKKLLSELYGDVWKSIRTLKKKSIENNGHLNAISKKLFNQDDEKENIRDILAENKKLYLTGSDVKKTKFQDEIDKKSRKKLYTEKVPSTPDPIKLKIPISREVKTTTKKIKGKSVTELVEIMKDKFHVDSLVDGVKCLDVKTPDVKIRNGEMPDAKIRNGEMPDVKIRNNVMPDVKIRNVVMPDVRTRNIELPENTKKVNTAKNKSQSTKKNLDAEVTRLGFVASLGDNIPTWRCHVEAFEYKDNFVTLRNKLSRRLYTEFNKNVFGDGLDADMPISWDTKLRSTAGTTTNRSIKNSNGDRIRVSSIKLSVKVLDTPKRLRDTLIHEMCHAATWIIDHELKDGHGPLWKRWAARALQAYPELVEIPRCHNLTIHYKYTYKCTKCGYSIQRHSKSIDETKKCCGYCRGTFQVIVNRKNKNGDVVSTPARKGAGNDFAKYVKENYATLKQGKNHAEVMKLLGEQYSARKKVLVETN